MQRKAVFVSGFLAFSVSVNAIDTHPNSVPMMTGKPLEVYTEQSLAEERALEAQVETVPNADILQEFRSAYAVAGEPSIAIFWNRKFDDQLSQWDAIARRSITGEASGNLSEVFTGDGNGKEEDALGAAVKSLNGQPSGAMLGSYERNVKGGGRILAAEYAEVRVRQQDRAGMGESADFEFASGYMQPFFNGRAKMLDRKAIMRLVERDQAKEAGSEMIVDYQKIETDALVGYAQYLAEIVFVSDASAELGKSFMVSVKEVDTGRVVAMFKSQGTPVKPPKEAEKVKWVAMPGGGYEKAAVPSDLPPTVEEVGEQLAYETMSALSNVWKNF